MLEYCISREIYVKLRSAPGFKSASTDVFISHHGPIQGYSQIGVLSKFSYLWPMYWLGLGHTSVTSFDIDFKKVRNGHRIDNER